MGLTFSRIDGNSRNFKILLVLLAVFTVIGFIFLMVSYISGHHVLGSSSIIPWGLPITITIYLIGLSAGSLILSALTYVFGKEEYRPIARLAVYLAIILIFGAMIGIALDLGRPEKSWRLFMFFVLNNMRSMFALNGILYGGYFLIGIIYLGTIFADKHQFIKMMGKIAIGWAALVHMGTGAIFGFIATRPIFFSPIKPFEFLAAAMVSGLALLIIVVAAIFKFTKRNLNKDIIFSLSRLLRILIIVLAVMVLVDKLTHLYPPDREATIWLLTGPYSWIFWLLQVGLAYVLPLVILFHPQYRQTFKGVIVAAFSVVIGIFGERFSLVIPGTAYPLPFYPGKIEGIWGMAGSFPITPVEFFMSLGIFTLMCLLLLVGLKNLELLPVDEIGQQTSEVAKKT
jgi:Ni/Fe-hydrogenase subunit HybB-like protein